MSPSIELQCWLVLASSVITSASAVLALVADRYQETLAENIALCCVALAGLIVAMQIYTHGHAQMSGFTFLAASVAFYAAHRAFKKWRELYR